MLFSWLMLLVLLVVFTGIATFFWGTIFGKGEVMDPKPDVDELKDVNREFAKSGDFQRISFDVVPRGYRQDQVDDMLEQLAATYRKDS